MKLVSITLENFRAYEKSTTLNFDDLTTIIGQNDIGKSSILEALEIFFNNKAITIEQSDANVHSGLADTKITLEFSDLPAEITLDAGALTSLQGEYLLSSAGTLVIQKVYDSTKKAMPCETFILANHPTASGVDNLLELKEKDLQKLVKDKGLDVPLKGNPGMRRALWDASDELGISEVAIPISKPKEDSKQIWEQIEARLPMFALFQSDRPSKETDGEIQNPLRGAVATAIAEVQDQIDIIQKMVKEKAEEIANLTHESLRSIDPNLAESLSPTFTPPTPAKWNGLFSLGMDTDDSIPLNKRGSGVRRLILVSFFKAEAERKLESSSKANIIYAIEEPETSQHPSNQKILIDSFCEISQTPNCQVILTTHSPGLAGELPTDGIRFISANDQSNGPIVRSGVDVYEDVANALGLIPDSRIKVLVCVEGPTDIAALKYLSHALHKEDSSIPCLLTDQRIAFVPLGGSTLKHWVTSNYLKGIGRPEVHIYDGDVKKYQESVDEVNSRTDGLGSWATQTKKHEIESYLHPDAIKEEFGISMDVADHPESNSPAVPEAFGIEYAKLKVLDNPMGGSKSKLYLSRAFSRMTAERIRDRDPNGEVLNWFKKISVLLQ